MATPLSLTLRLKSLGATALATGGLAAFALVPLGTKLRLKSLGQSGTEGGAVVPFTSYALAAAPLKYSRGSTTKYWLCDVWVSTILADGRIIAGQCDAYPPNSDTYSGGTGRNSRIALISDASVNMTATNFNSLDVFGTLGQTGSDTDGTAGTGAYNYKLMGLASIDGTLFASMSRHNTSALNSGPDYRQPTKDAQLIKFSADYSTFAPQPPAIAAPYAAPTFPGTKFSNPVFLQYGPNYSQAGPHGSDQYVYAMSSDGFWDNSDGETLGRVLRSKFGDTNGADWSFSCGLDGSNNPIWGSLASSVYVVGAPGSRKWSAGVVPVYLPAFGGYLLINWYYTQVRTNSVTNSTTFSQDTTVEFYWMEKPWSTPVKIGPDRRFNGVGQGFYHVGVWLPSIARDGGRHLLLAMSGDFAGQTAQGSYTLHFEPLALAEAGLTPLVEATGFTITGPETGPANSPAAFTIGANGKVLSPITVTLTDGTASVTGTLPAGDSPTTVVNYTPTNTTAKTLTVTGGGLDKAATSFNDTYSNLIASSSSGPFDAAPWSAVGINGTPAPVVVAGAGDSPRTSATNDAARLTTSAPASANGGSCIQLLLTGLISGEIYNFSSLVKGLSAGQKQMINAQKAGDDYANIGANEFTPDTVSGGFVDTDFTVPAGYTSVYLSLGMNQSFVGAPHDQTGGAMLIDMLQVTAGSGRKPFKAS